REAASETGCKKKRPVSYPRGAPVRVAVRAAAERPWRPLFCAARRADAELSVLVPLRAADRACRESAFLDAAYLVSCFSARSMALERRRDVFRLCLCPAW